MKKLAPSLSVGDTCSLLRALCSAVSAHLASAAAEDRLLSLVTGELSALQEELQSAANRPRDKSHLREADLARDAAFKALGTILKGYAALPFEEKRESAEVLLSVYEVFGSETAQESYANESSLISSLLEKLGDASLSAHIAALEGVAEAIAALTQAEEAFRAQSDAYTAALSERGEAAWKIKGRAIKAVNEKLIPYLNAAGAIDAESYGALSNLIEAHITRAEQVLGR